MRLGCLIFFCFLYGCGGGKNEEGGSPLIGALPKITHFYPNANPAPKGEDVTLCYGTENADTVTLDPYADTLKPSFNRCVSVRPEKATTYTLTATGPGGTVNQSVTLEIGPPAPKTAAAPTRQLIQNFQFLGPKSVASRTPVQFCYSTAAGATSVTVQPAVANGLKPGGNQCFTAPILQTTTFILTARDNSGATDRMQVTVNVK